MEADADTRFVVGGKEEKGRSAGSVLDPSEGLAQATVTGLTNFATENDCAFVRKADVKEVGDSR